MILFRDENDLDNAIEKGWIRQAAQGKNSNGKPRPDKFHIRLDKIPPRYCIDLDSEIEYKILENLSDKSGKATPLDRILILAPENSNPVPLITNEEIQSKPILEDSPVSLEKWTRKDG